MTSSPSRPSRPARRRNAAFTLIELLIVMSIIGIMAAIVVPRFTSADDPAYTASTRTTLHNLRKALVLYKVHHNDRFPTLAELADNWSVLLHTTDADGNVTPDGAFAPYLRILPTNPYTDSTTVVAPGFATSGDGFIYNEQTGEIHAVGFDEDTDTFTPPATEPAE